MTPLLADLHIHTALSPCAADEMTPPAIVRAAHERGLALVAICDHNAAGNAAACMAAAQREGGPTVIPGIEITTAEEVHLVALFPSAEQAESAAAEAAADLPPADDAYYARFGPQRLLDAGGQLRGMERRMLALATSLELSAAVGLVHRHGGLAIAAHVNRPSFSVLSQLGVFPAEAGFDAVEVFTPCEPGAVRPPRERKLDEYVRFGLPLIASSDAHFLGDIGRARTLCEMETASFAELRGALAGEGGRRVRVDA